MFRVLIVVACLGAAAGTITAAAQRPAPPNPAGRVLPDSADAQATLRSDLNGMTTRLGGGRGTSRDAMADARRLAVGYRGLAPLVRTFGPADHALNRDVARRSLFWLSRAAILYGADPLAARTFLDAYGAIGGFYRDYGHFYVPGAYVAYAGAARLAQRLAFATSDASWFEHELDRYALAYGTLATLNGTFIPPWTTPQDLPDTAPPPTRPPVVLTPLALPPIDVSTLEPAQRERWTDVRDRFRSVAASVHGARVLLDQLAERLRGQGLTLNPETAATALKMQGSLEDASELIQAKEFDAAIDALRRADYQRGKLRSATGQ